MKCPIDNTELVMSERQSVEIDYCPKCRGVWLDRGELDKIIEKVESENPRQNSQPAQAYPEQSYQGGKHGNEGGHGGYKKKRGGFLGELFD
jgi:Zn-finger nucleic acid-binding protein